MGSNEKISKEKFRIGDYIFFEGDLDFHFYIIESGNVQIFTKDTNGKRIDIANVGPGETFGEFALLDHKPRSASAQASSECVLVKVNEEGYNQLLAELPDWASSMLKSFSVRLKNMNVILKNQSQFVPKR
jgi:CRP-like cAMP-binding protein